MNSTKNIIIAIPKPSLAEGLKKMVETKGFKVIDIIVVLDHLIESVEKYSYDGIHLDGVILSTDLALKLDDQRLELLSDTLLTIRERYHHLHFVILSDQKPGHPFLAELSLMGIHSIFLRGEEGSNTSLNVDDVLATFHTPMPFTTKYKDIDTSIPWRKFYKGGSPIDVHLKGGSYESSSDDPQIQHTANETKIKEIVKEKIVQVTKYVEVVLPSTFCIFISLTPRAGGTFLSSNLAVEISKRDIACSFYELPTNRPVIFDQLKIWNRDKPYIPGITQLETDGFISKENELSYQGVNWYINHPEDKSPQTTYEMLIRLLNQSRDSTVTLLDISSAADNPVVQDIMSEATHIFLVIDPDPVLIERIGPNSTNDKAKETPEYNLLQRLVQMENRSKASVNLIVNKMNNGVDRKTLETVLPIKPIAYIPYFSPEDVYRASWEGMFYSEIATDLDHNLLPIMKEILSIDIQAKKARKSSFWNLLSGKKRRTSNDQTT